MEPAEAPFGATLIAAVAGGDPAAAATFKASHAALLEQICDEATPRQRRGEAYRDLLAADLAALFQGFEGRSTAKAFVTAAVVNRFVFPRLLDRIRRDPLAHADEFHAFFFRPAIDRLVRHAVLDEGLLPDATQWIFTQLLDRDGERLRAFAMEARSPGFVVCKLKFLAQDFLSSRDAPAERRKRTLPACLDAVPEFDKAVFRQFYWLNASSTQVALLGLLSRHPDATAGTVRAARARVEALLSAHGGSQVTHRETESLDAQEPAAAGRTTAVEPADAEDTDRSRFRAALLEAAKTLGSREVLYLLKKLEGKPAAVIAREMRLPVGEIYDLGTRVKVGLRRRLATHPAALARIASITGNESYVEGVPKPPGQPKPAGPARS